MQSKYWWIVPSFNTSAFLCIPNSTFVFFDKIGTIPCTITTTKYCGGYKWYASSSYICHSRFLQEGGDPGAGREGTCGVSWKFCFYRILSDSQKLYYIKQHLIVIGWLLRYPSIRLHYKACMHCKIDPKKSIWWKIKIGFI